MNKGLRRVFSMLFLIMLACFTLAACEPKAPPEEEGHTHSYSEQVVAPTCTEDGYTVFTCECGDTYDGNTVTKLGHSFTAYTSNNDADCLNDGTETATCDREGCSETDTRDVLGSALGHDFDGGTFVKDVNNHWKKCSRCEAEDTANKVGHSGGTATCTAKAKCADCGEEYGAFSSHDFTNGEIKFNGEYHWKKCANCVVEDTSNQEAHTGGVATCLTAGKCTVCEQDYVSALGHDFASSTKYASDGVQHWKKCANCSVEDTENKADHEGGTATCSKGKICTVCAGEYGEKTAHDFTSGSEYLADASNHWKKCANCDAGDTDNKSIHTGGTATCSEKARCSVCSTVYGDFAEHSYGEYKYNDTYHWKECTCGAQQTPATHKASSQDATKCECGFVLADAGKNLLGFENATELARVTTNQENWPVSIDTTTKRSGSASLKVSVTGTSLWPEMIFAPASGTAWNATGATAVRIYLYNTNSTGGGDIVGLALNVTDGTNSYTISASCGANEWTKIEIKIDELLTKYSSFNLSAMTIKFVNSKGTYDNRSVFYLDDLEIVGDEPVIETDPYFLGFEIEEDRSERIGYTGENNLFWPSSISSAVKLSGDSSLKVAPHAEWGTWPSIIFLPKQGTAWDLNGVTYISVWVYNSNNLNVGEITGFGLEVSNGLDSNASGYQGIKVTAVLPAGEWTKITLKMSSLLSAYPTFNLSEATIKFVNAGSGYANRSVFYLDDFTVSFEELETGFTTKESAEDLSMFVPDNDLYVSSINTNAAFVNEGDSSFKFSCIQKWPSWKFSSEFIDWLNSQGYTTLKFKIYFDAENAGTDLNSESWGTQGLAGYNNKTMNTWIDVEAKVGDLTTDTIIFQLNKNLEEDFNVYIDAFEFVK